MLLLACATPPLAKELPGYAGERPDDQPSAEDTATPAWDTGADTATPGDSGEPTDSGEPEVPPLDCMAGVLGHDVDEPACGWLDYTGRTVVPELAGSRDDRLDLAAMVAWWSLKEGVLFLDNPLVYSNCGDGSGYIDPLEVCSDGYAWQVGLSGVQVPTFDVDDGTTTAEELYPELSTEQVLRQAAERAGLSEDEVGQVVASSGDLRTSWLLRAAAVGFTLQVDIVERECVEGSYSWCYGTGWTSTSLYAPDRDSALQAIEDLRALLDQVAPG